RYACVGNTGKLFPARISGVAKSASDAANNNKNALAMPGMHSGSVTVRKTRARDAPRLCAIVSILESMPARIGRSVRYAIGKYVSASEKSVAPSPYTENPLTPKTPYVTRPRGPKEKIIAIAAVNGGETSGSSTLA